MTNQEKIQTAASSIDELAKWMDKHCIFDNSPWMDWWDKTYCSNCESIICHYTDYLNVDIECCYCEVNGNCKYFPELKESPDILHIIKLWLMSEDEGENL